MEDRVRLNTAAIVNQKIDLATRASIAYYSSRSAEEISERIQALEKEWDIERVLALSMATLALTGIGLRLFKNRGWLILPAAVLGFFAQHAIQGWCPPLPVLRRLGLRTREEIDQEKYALKVLRGDFENKQHADSAEVFDAVL